MSRAAFFSALLHVGVTLLVIVGVPTLFVPEASFDRVIPVTIYTVAEETQLPEPAPERGRKLRWKPFLKAHWQALAAADFFSVEVLTWGGLVRYSVLVVMEVGF